MEVTQKKTGVGMSTATARLLSSVDVLERAIINAKESLLGASEVSLAARLDSHLGICQMQRRLAREIGGRAAQRDFQEVQRLTNLINGLSAMILDDVKLILNGLPDSAEDARYHH